MRPFGVYLLMVLLGAAAFLYPFWLPSSTLPSQAHGGDAPLVAALVGALVIAAVMLEVRRGTMNGATVAILGMLSAVAGLLRLIDLPGGGSGIFFLVVLAGAAFGPRFGLLLGLCAMAVSAIVTGGIGPWLPFQMLALVVDGRGRGLRRPAHPPPRSAARGGRARRVRVGLGVPLRGDHEPLVLAVRPRRRARLAPGPRPGARRCTATGSSTWPRRSGGTPPPPSPTPLLILVTGLVLMRTLRRFAHRLDPAVEFTDPPPEREVASLERV